MEVIINTIKHYLAIFPYKDRSIPSNENIRWREVEIPDAIGNGTFNVLTLSNDNIVGGYTRMGKGWNHHGYGHILINILPDI